MPHLIPQSDRRLRPAPGREWVHYEWSAGGNGAFAEDDGPSAMATIDWGDLVTVQSSEVMETRMPLLVESSRLATDSRRRRQHAWRSVDAAAIRDGAMLVVVFGYEYVLLASAKVGRARSSGWLASTTLRTSSPTSSPGACSSASVSRERSQRTPR